MSRWEFLRQLEELLSDISPSEREEALQYYNDYFNDAGKENESEVMEALGSPEQVAKIVKDGLGDNENLGEYTENGFSSGTVKNENAVAKREMTGAFEKEDTQKETNTNRQAGNNGTEEVKNKETASQKEEMPVWAIVLIVLACILFSPVILGLATGALGIIVSIVAAAAALVFGFGLAALVLFVAAIALIIGGFGCLFVSPLAGVGMFGGSLICASIGILCMLLTIFVAGKLIPGIFQGIGYIWNRIFGKKGGAAV